jgi:tetratricopeptide (TPR) repeat protein
MRRNKVTFVSGAAVILALIIGLGFSTWFWSKERVARKRAVEAQNQALVAEQEQRHLRMEAEDRERVTQAAFLISQNKIAEADDLVGKVSSVKPSLETELVLRTLGEWHALKGQWDEAAARFNLLLEADQRDNSWAITDDLLKAGPILIERGDMKGYEHFRQVAIARYTGTKDPIFAERTLKICLLTPADDKLIRMLQPFSDLAQESMGDRKPNELWTAWRCVSLALMAYRQNYTPTAIDWCRKCLSFTDGNVARYATAHVIEAMSCYKLGEVERARSELTQGRDLINAQSAEGLKEGNGGIGFWYDWLFARILLREAEALIEKPVPAGVGK